MAETRIVVEQEKCQHGFRTEHLLYPPNVALSCPGPTRRVLSDALVVERVDGQWPDWARKAVAIVTGFSMRPVEILDALAASRKELTGDCEIDCRDECAYPGQFTECELGAAPGEDG